MAIDANKDILELQHQGLFTELEKIKQSNSWQDNKAVSNNSFYLKNYKKYIKATKKTFNLKNDNVNWYQR